MLHNKNLTENAQRLRKNMTKEERKLWYEYLSNYPNRFRRQVTCGRFILDFYCASAKLAIELDGSQHYTDQGSAQDQARDAYLASLGLQVVRYANSDVNQRFGAVCEDILNKLPMIQFLIGKKMKQKLKS